jgi:hypothetical protein
MWAGPLDLAADFGAPTLSHSRQQLAVWRHMGKSGMIPMRVEFRSCFGGAGFAGLLVTGVCASGLEGGCVVREMDCVVVMVGGGGCVLCVACCVLFAVCCWVCEEGWSTTLGVERLPPAVGPRWWRHRCCVRHAPTGAGRRISFQWCAHRDRGHGGARWPGVHRGAVRQRGHVLLAVQPYEPRL